MMNQNKRRMKQSGFTLMEVMIVLVILGLLSAMVVPNIMANLERANMDKAKTDIARLDSIMESYKVDNNRYPTTEQGLQALVNKPEIDPVPRRYLPGGYVKSIPKDPWGNDYVLVSPNEQGRFDLYSLGKDGQEGTEDDIGNWETDEQQ